MGLLGRLLGRTQTPVPDAGGRQAGIVDRKATLYTGNETLEVVGESHYQEALWSIVGGRRSDRVRHETVAVLIPDPDNQYDPNAIRVVLEGSLVGYLSGEDAPVYLPGLLRLMDSSANRLVALDGIVVGGGQRPDGLGLLGVFLDHNPTDFGIEPRRFRDIRGFRTGFSEALATDLVDDSYDLSWSLKLSDNDVTAIKQLRTMLVIDPDPIDRHYMMCELEKRLYKSRDAFSSALDEFDLACQQHHSELESTIRSALCAKFDKVPLLELYRQAAIRCQKSKDWESMRSWTERGLKAYGEEAAQSDHVEDLRKRLAYAMAKIESPVKSKGKAPSRTSIESSQGPVMETLVCATCGASFERVRTGGRKPRECPVCREA